MRWRNRVWCCDFRKEARMQRTFRLFVSFRVSFDCSCTKFRFVWRFSSGAILEMHSLTKNLKVPIRRVPTITFIGYKGSLLQQLGTSLFIESLAIPSLLLQCNLAYSSITAHSHEKLSCYAHVRTGHLHVHSQVSKHVTGGHLSPEAIKEGWL